MRTEDAGAGPIRNLNIGDSVGDLVGGFGRRLHNGGGGGLSTSLGGGGGLLLCGLLLAGVGHHLRSPTVDRKREERKTE